MNLKKIPNWLIGLLCLILGILLGAWVEHKTYKTKVENQALDFFNTDQYYCTAETVKRFNLPWPYTDFLAGIYAYGLAGYRNREYAKGVLDGAYSRNEAKKYYAEIAKGLLTGKSSFLEHSQKKIDTIDGCWWAELANQNFDQCRVTP